VFDAGVAAGLCLNVVQPDMTSMGGVAPFILREARSGQVMTVSGMGWWPRATSASRYSDAARPLTTGVMTC
jgi:gamma-glutamyltranspeptidase/glutathione hydrolase